MSGTKRSGTNAVAISKKKIKTVDVCGYMDCSVDVSCYLLDFLISLFVVDFFSSLWFSRYPPKAFAYLH